MCGGGVREVERFAGKRKRESVWDHGRDKRWMKTERNWFFFCSGALQREPGLASTYALS